ncbi:MAG: VacJ family lipoprotein [Deltaproteobacteria bacterium]|nr:VacJ family lipoprotein [Deltaproteobacteria bacterium]
MIRLVRLAALVVVLALARAGTAATDLNHDPLVRYNRAMFWFNDRVDVYVLEPVATGWDTIAPNRVKQALSHFFQNLRFPIVAGNNLLQAKFVDTASDIGRFVINTTVGVAGFFDPATPLGLEEHNEDFGQTLGYWGVPPGPYLVLPLLGPSNPRDTAGLLADSFSTVYPFFVEFQYLVGARTIDLINARALALNDVRRLKEASLDYYTAVRNGYGQHRQRLVQDEAEMTEQQQTDLYTIEPNGESR